MADSSQSHHQQPQPLPGSPAAAVDAAARAPNPNAANNASAPADDGALTGIGSGADPALASPAAEAQGPRPTDDAPLPLGPTVPQFVAPSSYLRFKVPPPPDAMAAQVEPQPVTSPSHNQSLSPLDRDQRQGLVCRYIVGALFCRALARPCPPVRHFKLTISLLSHVRLLFANSSKSEPVMTFYPSPSASSFSTPICSSRRVSTS